MVLAVETRNGTSRPLRPWLFACAVFLALGLAESAQAYWLYEPESGALSVGRALGIGLGIWCTWTLIWLIVFPLARRYPLGPHHWRSRLPLHLGCSVACALLKMLLDYPAIKFCFFPTPNKLTFTSFLQITFAGYFLRYVLFYWAMLGVVHALDYYGKYRDGQLRAAHLETGLARARLQLLKTQLHPHFLFNTLNAISALIHTDVEAADGMLARLGDLLRLALQDFGVQEAPLARELEVIRSYLEIEQARLGPRLQVKWDVPADVTDAVVPTFLLQPLLENAIRHGIAPRPEPGCIEIRAWRVEDELNLEVRDDGPGLRLNDTPSGVGLANTRARLRHLYGESQRLDIENDSRGGCVVRIALPFYQPVAHAGPGERGDDDPHADRG